MTTKKSPTNHLELWHQVEKTPINHTKKVTKGARIFNSVDSMYSVKRATEMFGPIGIGWGFEVLEERYDKMAPQVVKNGEVVYELMHTLKLELWYKWQGETGKIIQYGHTPALYMSGSAKWVTDTDPAKKSLTDAIKKCLSLTGVCADVFFGMYDDADYVENRKVEARIEQADDREKEAEEYRREYADWIKESCETLRKIPHTSSVVNAANAYIAKVADKARLACVDPQKGISILRKAADDQIAEIQQKAEARVGDQQIQQQDDGQQPSNDEQSGGEA